MSEPRTPGDLPPDLPPEYAEAYRRGYERAYQEAVEAAQQAEAPPAATEEHPREPESTPAEDATDAPTEPATEAFRVSGPLFADDRQDAFGDDPADHEPTQVVPLPTEPVSATQSTPSPTHPTAPPPPAPTHPTPSEPAEPEPKPWPGGLTDDLVRDPGHYDDADERRRPGWFVPAILAGLVLLLVIAAYGIGRLFSSSVDDADVSSQQPDEVVLGDGAASQGAGDGGGNGGKSQPQPEQPDAYQGRTELAAVGGATATCQAPASVDAAGNEIAYPPTNTYDGDLTTAWRCNGDGVGQSLTLTLPESTRIGEVGLVPGYAKTDPRSGVDRYAENNRITKVRWTFADGTSFEQELDGSATNRELQTIRIPVTESDSAVLEVLATTSGPRNTTAVSEIRLGSAVE